MPLLRALTSISLLMNAPRHRMTRNEKAMVAIHPFVQAKCVGARGMAAPADVGCFGSEAAVPDAKKGSARGDVFWYFAIGAMMNPMSVRNRNIEPLASAPGELLGFELKFFGPMGFAEAVPCPGASFHGVLVSCCRRENC